MSGTELYRLNAAESALLARVVEIAETTVAEHAADVDTRGRFPRESMAVLGEAGLWGLTVPTEYGGLGGSLRLSAAALDEIAQRCASTAMVYLMHLSGIAAYRAHPRAAAAALRAAAQGKHLSTLAWSEAGSRSHFWAPVSKVRRRDGRTTLNASKSWVTSAGHADGYVVTIGGDPEGIDLYLLDKGDRGLAVSGPWDALGMRGNASAPMVLNDVEVSADRILGEPGKALGTMMGSVFPQFAIGNAAVSVGVCEAAVQSTRAHLTGTRFEHLKSKLADLPTLRARLATMRIETDRARAHLAAVIDAAEAGAPAAMLMVLESKAAAGDTALVVTDIGMRACGGAAFSKHLGLERFFRDARAMSAMAPTSDALHDFIGKALCGMELFA